MAASPYSWRAEQAASWAARRRLTPAEVADYSAGRITITQLASTYGVTRASLRGTLRYMGVYRKS